MARRTDFAVYDRDDGEVMSEYEDLDDAIKGRKLAIRSTGWDEERIGIFYKNRWDLEIIDTKGR